MKEFFGYLRENYGPWGWMGQRAHDAAGINRLLPLDFIVSCSAGRELRYFFDENKAFSVEKLSGNRKNWSNEDLKDVFNGALGEDVLLKWKEFPDRPNVLCYRSIENLEKEVKGTGISPRMFAVPEKLKKMLDDKILLYNSLDAMGIEKIPGKIEFPDRLDFDAQVSESGVPFVVQFAYGSNGEHTFIVKAPGDLEKARKACPGEKAVVRKFIDGFSFNVNAVIVTTSSGPRVVVSYPSVQITGLRECSNFISSYCGNDFSASADVDPLYIDKVEQQTLKVGSWMAEKGYRGIFGMDFLAKDGKVYPVEINPRFQNSTSLYIALRAVEGGADILSLHISEFLRERDPFFAGYIEDFDLKEPMRPLNGAQIVLHNKTASMVAAGDMMAGQYRSVGDDLEFIREAALIGEDLRHGDLLITCGVPRRFMLIQPDAPLCKIQCGRSVLCPDRKNLDETSRKAVLSVYEKLNLCDEDMLEKVGA